MACTGDGHRDRTVHHNVPAGAVPPLAEQARTRQALQSMSVDQP